jgi:hypothetical protein
VKTVTKAAIGAGLVAVTLAALFDPARWLMPGHVTPGHKEIETDCLACHAPFRGTPAKRCIDCHDPRALTPGATKAAGAAHISVAELHRLLPLDDCASCHAGHLTATRTVRNAAFDHTMIPAASRSDCARCHRPPADTWHPKDPGQCSDCHATAGWIPAQFDHAKYFPLEGPHAVACKTCHTGNDRSTYTCTGCHEHSPERVARQHAEEGIRRDLSDCVACHRDGTEHGGRGDRLPLGDRLGEIARTDDVRISRPAPIEDCALMPRQAGAPSGGFLPVLRADSCLTPAAAARLRCSPPRSTIPHPTANRPTPATTAAGCSRTSAPGSNSTGSARTAAITGAGSGTMR